MAGLVEHQLMMRASQRARAQRRLEALLCALVVAGALYVARQFLQLCCI
jgi:hypothetical protein